SSRYQRRRLRIVEQRDFLRSFFPEAPGSPLHFPGPPDARYAWARQHAGAHAFALCGVTHTLCSLGAVALLRELVTAPFEPYDALTGPSRAVTDMVRAVPGAYADSLRDRHGGAPTVRPRLELIPLGVNPEQYRPPSEQERTARRA